MDIYFIFLLIFTCVSGYLRYKLYKVFYESCKVSKSIEYGIFIFIQIIMTAFYLSEPAPILMAISNIVVYFLYAFVYSNNIRKNIIVVSSIFAVQIAIEAIAYSSFVSTGLAVETTISYKSVDYIISTTAMNIIHLIIVILVYRIVKPQKDYILPKSMCIYISAIPVSSIFLLLAILQFDNISETMFLSISLFCLFVNVPVFFLYDGISKLMAYKINQRVFLENQKHYENQLLLMKSQLDDIKTLKHDLKNKLTPLYLYAEQGDMNAIQDKLAEVLGICNQSASYSNTGCIDIDSIINFKLGFAKKFTDDISTEIKLPENLKLADSDLAVVLGNLLDNATQGLQTSAQDKFLTLKISYSKGRLIITCQNSFDGVVKKKNGKYFTTKENNSDHGLGLLSVQNIFGKYNGVLKLKHTKDVFTATALLYMDYELSKEKTQ